MNQIVNTSVTRRQFVVSSASAAGGLAISVAFPTLADAASIGAQAWGPETAPNEINAFLAIDPDGTILIRSPHNEMGQGAITALPMIVAEELECDWSKVKVEYASAARNLREKNVYGDMVTAGSRGVRTSWQMLLQAGASARVRLIAAAAQRWNVPATECEAANSKITHKPSGRSLDYGALAADAGKIKLDKEPAIRTPDQFKLIGKSVARLDTPLKINGSAKFAIDTQIPGMVYAAIAACPVFGGKLKSVDEAPVKGRRGVLQVVKLGDAGGGCRSFLARQGSARATQAGLGRGRGRQDRQRAICQALPRHTRRTDGERAQRRQCR
jgi:isoquinoline 1-oxidoreductase beta subunit